MKKFFAVLLTVLLFVLWFVIPAYATEGSATLHSGDWVYLLNLLVVPFARKLAKKTKTDADDKAVGFVGNLLHIVGLKWGRVRL